MSLDKPFTGNDLRIEEEKTVFEGFFKVKKFWLKHKLFGGGESKVFTRELFCRGQSVGVLLYDPQRDLLGLVKQFRIGCLNHARSPWVWEVIAGVNDKQERPQQVAVREIMEESGLAVQEDQLLPICDYYASPGGSDEHLHLFCAITDLTMGERVHGVQEENEDILFKVFAYDLAIDAMLRGEMNNAATIICLQWLQLNRVRLMGRLMF